MWQRLLVKLGCLFALMIAGQSYAAAVLPGSVEPAQVGKALQQQQPQNAPNLLPPIVNQAQPKPIPVSPEAAKIKFHFNGIILIGNTVFTEADLKPIWEDKLHKVITIYELFQIIQDITNYYRNAGYILSKAVLIPQHVKNGVIKVRIVEGYIGNIEVQGQPYGAYCMVYRFGYRIKQCPPLQLSRMERYLLLANEIPNTQVRAVLTPSKNQTGAADLVLVTQNYPITGYASYDNYGTRYLGPQQMTGSISLNSFIFSGDSTTATMTKTPKGGELTYIDVNYNTPVDDNGTRWIIGGTRVHTHPLFVLRDSQIDGLNDNYYTNVYFPTIRERTRSLTWRIGFNYLDSDVTTFGQRLYADHLRPIDIGGTYNFSDDYYGTNMISGDIRQGLPIWGYTSNTNIQTAETSRPGGRGRFTKIGGQASRVQILTGAWSLFAIAQGQYAFMPLLAPEQFTFGGPTIGRGYDVAELIGDKGAAASVELRYDMGFNHMLRSMQFYAFYDAGIIWNYEFIGSVPRQQSATSAGIGSRFIFTQYISGNIMWAQPLTKRVAAEGLIGNGWRPRVFFSILGTIP